MEFRKLRLAGFKSFVEPATLLIEPGLTGVVGPNGCGKSNLLEAIRWVMGESSPKSLRSGGMEDVIFAGTASRPPRDFAEVVLSARDGSGDELEVTRRIERGAGSAYRINGRDVRAKDVGLIFADAATGAHSPALVSQGKIAQVIAARPGERRMMLEEAAGIAGLHVRRREAEGRLRQTEANLARLSDLLAGLDSQIATLRRQARQAERYKALSDDIRIAEARHIFARWRDAATEAEAASAQAQAAEAEVATAHAAASLARQSQADGASRLADLRAAQGERRDAVQAHDLRLSTLTSQLDNARQRLADLDRQRARLDDDRKDADEMTRAAATALASLESALATANAALTQGAAERPALAAKLEDSERAARAAELALAQATADNAGVEAEWRVAQAEVAQAQARVARLDGEARRLAEQRSALTTHGDPRTNLASARDDAARAASACAALRADLATQQHRKEGLTRARDDAAAALSQARADCAGIEREWQALSRDRDARARQAAGRAGQSVALDAVAAAPGYERALAAVLGRDAKALLGAAAQAAEGRFWTGAPAPAAVADNLAAHLRQCPEQLAARLALVHVADVDDGRVLAPGEWLVTLAGHLRRWDGFVARGEGASEAARLEADNRFAELDGRLPALRTAVAQAESTQHHAHSALAELGRDLVARERAVGEAAERERQALRQADQAEALADRLATRGEELAHAEADLLAQRDLATHELAAAQSRHAALPDPAAGRAALEASRARHDGARLGLQGSLAALAAQDQALAAARERVATQRADMRGWQARAGDAAKRLAGMDARFAEIDGERAIMAAKPLSLEHEIASGELSRAQLRAALGEADTAVANAEGQARAADAALAQASEALAVAREARAGAIARAESANTRRAEMARASGERFQCPPPLLPEHFAFAADQVRPAGAESEEMERLIAARERIGPVNLVAAADLARMEAEQSTNAAEAAELGEAVARLHGSIASLNREGRERLRAAFEAVNGHFRHLFARLFEGGAAYLALVDSDDPLEAGLEIYAQPPGKRLQSLSLLSGGEQALTATALIFALFLTNPAPICVLDEVDAPLDDANIERFCDLLDAMVRETATRYLIVTHNAVTMSRMHRLFGVTMVERGVSRLVSVALDEAERMAAE